MVVRKNFRTFALGDLFPRTLFGDLSARERLNLQTLTANFRECVDQQSVEIVREPISEKIRDEVAGTFRFSDVAKKDLEVKTQTSSTPKEIRTSKGCLVIPSRADRGISRPISEGKIALKGEEDFCGFIGIKDSSDLI